MRKFKIVIICICLILSVVGVLTYLYDGLINNLVVTGLMSFIALLLFISLFKKPKKTIKTESRDNYYNKSISKTSLVGQPSRRKPKKKSHPFLNFLLFLCLIGLVIAVVSADPQKTLDEDVATTAESTVDVTKQETTAVTTKAEETTHTPVTTPAVTEPPETEVKKFTVVLNTSTKVYHLRASCRAAKQIKSSNYATREVTSISELSGYKACGICSK